MQFNLKRVRLDRNMTQAELSEKSGVGRVTIIRIESGRPVNASIGTLVKLSSALQCTLDELVG
jgi:transcriptional regulator with XRE-family HTH domain